MTLLRRVLFLVALLVAWELLARRSPDATLLPGPLAVGRTLWGLLADGSLPDAVAVSLRRVILGYLVSLLVGVPLGIGLARSRAAEETLGMLVTGFGALPSICWLPLALLWFGLNDRAILFVVVMGSMVSIATAVRDGVRNLPPTYVRAGRTMGARGLRLTLGVLLPASLPAILTGAKLGWAYAWRALMSGELLFVSLGLGHLLMMGRELSDMAQVLSVMIVIVLLGLLADGMVFGSLERLVRRRWGLGTA